MWHVYIVKCSDGTLYTGVAKDLARRVSEHNSSALGARYTKARRPVKLVYAKEQANRSLAQKEECRIKKLTRIAKIKLIAV